MVFEVDLSILGSEVVDELLKTEDNNTHAAIYLRKGRTHKTCDDSALLIINKNFTLFGVFDGVSGEPFAQNASETALRAVKFYVTQNFGRMAHNTLLENAIAAGNFAIERGATTATVVLLLPSGEFFFGNIGDSHLYKIDEGGKVERITKDYKGANGSGVTEYFRDRYLVGNCLGGLIKEGEIEGGQGKIKENEFLLAMSDGVMDNLYVEVEGGAILDASGKRDLESMLSGRKTPQEIIETIAKTVISRMSGKEVLAEGKILVPKEDDVSIVVLKH